MFVGLPSSICVCHLICSIVLLNKKKKIKDSITTLVGVDVEDGVAAAAEGGVVEVGGGVVVGEEAEVLVKVLVAEEGGVVEAQRTRGEGC